MKEDQYDLEDFGKFVANELDQLPSQTLAAKLRTLLRGVNATLCDHATLVQLDAYRWFLRWRERHPEMVSLEDYEHETLGSRSEWDEMLVALPCSHYELPLNRQQAFALFMAYNAIATAEFGTEHAAVLDALIWK